MKKYSKPATQVFEIKTKDGILSATSIQDGTYTDDMTLYVRGTRTPVSDEDDFWGGEDKKW